jgi:hypothetical protein
MCNPRHRQILAALAVTLGVSCAQGAAPGDGGSSSATAKAGDGGPSTGSSTGAAGASSAASSGGSSGGTTTASSSGGSGSTGAGCAGTPVFCDDYTNASLATAYTTYNGTWVRSPGSYAATDPNVWERAQATLADDVSDFDLTVQGDTEGDYGFGIIYAASADQNLGYAVLVHPAQFQSIYLKELVPGQADVNLASTGLAAGLAGTAMTLRVKRVGSQVQAWLNGTQMINASDDSNGATGRLGLLLSATNLPANAGAVFNLFRVDTATVVTAGGSSSSSGGSSSGTTKSSSGSSTTTSKGSTSSGGSSTSSSSTGSSGSMVNPAPTGPAVPAGGWVVDFADDFNAPLGTGAGQDNFWYPSQSWNAYPDTDAAGNNSYETEVYNASQVSVSGGLLLLTAVYQVTPGGDYVSGIVTSPTGNAGYQGFTWTPGDGSTWAFEIVCQWPVNTGELFNAWWSSTESGWTDERDFFEGHTTQGGIDTDWIYSTSPVAQDYYETTLGFDPSAAMHRYTYVVYGDQTWSFFIDGALQTWVGSIGVSPVESSVDAPMELIVNYALSAVTFTSGTRTFTIDSVAVYQDGAHAGQSTAGGGIAPGTVIGP